MNWKVEGNILYPDKSMLTWGPFYYHSKEKAKTRMQVILLDIFNWCNMKDPSLNICPQDIKRMDDQIVFDIQAWKDDITLQKYDGIIEIEFFKFEDNILEVKEVDLDAKIHDYINAHYSEGCDSGMISDAHNDIGGVTYSDLTAIAKHFFELGLKAQV